MTPRFIHAAQQLAKTILAHARSLLFAKPFKFFQEAICSDLLLLSSRCTAQTGEQNKNFQLSKLPV